VTLYGFHDSLAREPGDVPDEGELQLVVLPPRLTAVQGEIAGQTAAVTGEVTENYGKRLRMNRNMVLYLVPDSEYISGAIDRAMDWLATERVLGDAGLMECFSEVQQETVRDRATTAANDTKDHVRKAYNTVALPSGPGTHEPFELGYVPPSKTVLDQAQEELLNRRKVHTAFNPELLEGRWASLWPGTATVTTTAALWEKFARQGGAPILTGIEVLQETIHQAVARELFGYGLLHDSGQDKLKASSYERVFLGPFDARELGVAEISNRALLMRRDQVYALFPPISKEEVAMVLEGPRQAVETVFRTARQSLTVQGRVDRRSFFGAICEGVKAGLFGYATVADAPVVRGSGAELTLEDVQFSGLLIGEEVPLPVTADEVAEFVPAEGRLSVQELHRAAMATYGAERASEQSLLNALRRCVAEGRFGYAASETAAIQTGPRPISLDGYIGQPEVLPPDARFVRFSGAVSSVELANVMKAAINLSKLGESRISLDLRLELKGEVSDHAVTMALNELKSRVGALKVEDLKGNR
jgi:hypothetical protein